MEIALHHPHKQQQLLVLQRYAQMEYLLQTQHAKYSHINVSLMERSVYYQEPVKQLEQPYLVKDPAHVTQDQYV